MNFPKITWMGIWAGMGVFGAFVFYPNIEMIVYLNLACLAMIFVAWRYA